MTHEQDDAKIAARWLGWLTTRECKRQTTPIHSDKCPTCGASVEMDATTRYSMFQIFAHDIPPPDFADPAVYDRALRELERRGMGLRLWIHDKSHGWNLLIEPPSNYRIFHAPSGPHPTIGAAIAVAIAELARAEGANDADMGLQNRKPDERA